MNEERRLKLDYIKARQLKRNPNLSIEDAREKLAYGAMLYEYACIEIERLRSVIKQEADYCYGWAANAEMMGDDDRAKRHKERGDRLMSNI